MRRISIGLALLAATGPASAQGLAIDHRPVGCVVADKFPVFEARVSPADGVGRARVYFRGSGSAFYTVEMKLEAGVFRGVIPKPKKELAQLHYYIEVVTPSFAESRTAEQAAQVVPSAGACANPAMLAGVVTSASLVVGAASGASAIPAGFSAAGITSAGAAAGAGAAGAASTGGGIGATALVVGGLAIAGGAVAVGAAKGGDGHDSGDRSQTPNSGPSSNTVLNVLFLPSPPGIDVSVCTTRPLSWCCQTVNANASGSFNEVWAPNEPNTLRVVGQATSSSFQATLTCVNGARAGSISATGSNGNYSGSFEFGSSRGQVTVTK